MRTATIRSLLSLALTLLLAGPSAGQSIVRVIPLPNSTYWNSAWGLTADASHLYVASNTSDATMGRRIYTLDLDGIVVDSVDAPAGVVSSQGLARDSAGNFYYLRRYTSSGTVMKLSPAGALIDSFRIWSGKYPGGLAWDGSHLWFSLYYPNNECGLYKVDWATKTVVDTILVATLQPYGVEWDGASLLYVENGFDGGPRGVFFVDPATGDTTRFVPEPADQTSNGTSPRDVAWDGAKLWLLAEPVGASSGRVLYQYDLGGGGTPDIALSSSLLSFGNITIGSSLTLITNLSNTGTAALTVDSVRMNLSGAFTTSFATPVTIPAGSSEALSVTFTPAAFGPDSASLRIYSNDPDEASIPLALRGSGVFPGGVLSSPAGFSFGARRVGSSSNWTLTLQNLGGGQIIITSLDIGQVGFSLDSVALPLTIDSLQRRSLRVWFRPSAAGAVADTLRITSNASNGPVTPVWLAGSGDAAAVPIAQPFWQYTVPNHPVSNTDRLVKAVRAINDITGDGKPDIIVSTSNYWTMAVNGNGSVTTDSLWAFTTYITNSSAGSIGSTGDYSHQKALTIASDLNGDGYQDVVIGTGGGNEHVYALNGRTGAMLWTFGTDHPDSFSLGDFTGVDVARDFNGDMVPDVLAASAATQSGGVGGRRMLYLFNGSTGAILWQTPMPGFTHGVASIDDIDADGVPDALGTVGEPSYKLSAVSGALGALLWDFPVPSGSGGAKEIMILSIPGQTPDVILGAFWGPVFRVDAESGTQLWSTATGSGVMQFDRLRDITGDGIDEVLVALLGGGARCLNGATGAVLWSLPTGNTMGIASIPDLNQDGIQDVAIAVQNQGTMIVKGQDGVQLGLFATGTNQTREVAIVPDIDGNNSWEIIMGGKEANVALLSGGTDAGPNAVVPPPPVPDGWALHQNYPNPFNPSTTIRFDIPTRSDVRLTVVDLLGRAVVSFLFDQVPPGTHEAVWDGMTAGRTPASSGVYFCRLEAQGVVLTRTMMLVK